MSAASSTTQAGDPLLVALRALMGGELDGDRLRDALVATIRGGTPEFEASARLCGLLGCLGGAGVSPGQLAGVVEALDELATPFEHSAGAAALDTCGTGGDGLSTFNLSTATALVVASCGVPVIKHGNRAVSSSCGSADLLEEIGLAVDVDQTLARERLERTGFTFLFAPHYHAALAAIGPLRRAMGVPTAINLAAPLANPGGVRRQLIGVADGRALEAVRGVLERRAGTRAYVVHGAVSEDRLGADELTPCGPNRMLGVGGLPDLMLDPRELGLPRAPIEALACGGRGQAKQLLQGLLDGETGPLRDALTLNAGAALVVAERATDFAAGLEQAREALDSGATRRLVEALTQGEGK